MKSRKLLALPLLVGAVALAGCGGPKNETGTGGQSSGASTPTLAPVTAQDINVKDRADLQQGGTLRLPVADFGGGNWNISNINGNNDDLAHAMNPLLPLYFYYDAKGAFTPNPNYVVSADKTADNPTTVHVKLNPKAVWGDGSPVDLDDFEATWKALNGSNKKFQAASTEGWDQIAKVDQGADKFEYTVTWKGPYPDWDAVIGAGVLKAESVKDPDTFNTGWKTLNNDWLSGPFKVGSFDETQKVLTEVPNDKWWGEKPLLDKIVFRAISPDATAAAFVNNELDSFDIGPDPDAFQRASAVSDATVRKAAGPNYRHITFNTKAGLLTDKAVRQAIVMGLDRAAIGESDLAGIDWSVTPLNNMFLLTTQTGYEDEGQVTGIDYNVDKAKQTLEDAGWKVGADGYRTKDGKTLEVKFSQLSGVSVSENEALQVQNQLKQIGIKVTIVNVPISKFQDGSLLAKKEFELVAFSWIGTPHPYQFPGQLVKTGSESNFSQYSNPEVDKLIPQLATEVDPAKRATISNQIARIVWEDVSTLPLYQRPSLVAVKTKLANYGAFGLSDKAFPWENVGYEK